MKGSKMNHQQKILILLNSWIPADAVGFLLLSCPVQRRDAGIFELRGKNV
jgi:hypothetical protein